MYTEMGWPVGQITLLLLVNIYGLLALPVLNITSMEPPAMTMNEAMVSVSSYFFHFAKAVFTEA